jgi:hypothetical protein
MFAYLISFTTGFSQVTRNADYKEKPFKRMIFPHITVARLKRGVNKTTRIFLRQSRAAAKVNQFFRE